MLEFYVTRFDCEGANTAMSICEGGDIVFNLL